MSELVISVDEEERGTTVWVAGDLDLPGGDALEALIAPMLPQAPRVEVVMRDVAFVDSSGLGALLALSQLADDVGGKLVLRDPSAAVVAALELTHTAEMFSVALTAEEVL
jgi:anti-sigma B factor antagonist